MRTLGVATVGARHEFVRISVARRHLGARRPDRTAGPHPFRLQESSLSLAGWCCSGSRGREPQQGRTAKAVLAASNTSLVQKSLLYFRHVFIILECYIDIYH